MKKWGMLATVLAGLALAGCDDSTTPSSMDCELDCVHGTCSMRNGTQEFCTCDPDYYVKDERGACTIPKFLVSDLSQNGQDISFELRFPAGSKVSVLKDGNSVNFNQSGDKITIKDSFGSEKKVSYTITGTAPDGTKLDTVYLPMWNESTAWDWRKAVMYFTFIDRFSNGDTSNDNPLNTGNPLTDWMGGDFAGLKAKVEDGYFERLGVNTLWLSSVSMNTQKAVGRASAYHSYWPLTTGYTDETAQMFSNYTSNGVAITPIEPHFGTLSELRALVKACHDRGMRILVDFAVNHVEADSPVYIQHPEWFNHYNLADKDSILCEGPNDTQANWNIIPETCWFGENLPDFDYTKPEVRKFVVDHAKWLIRTTGIDGFRLDAVKHMPTQFIIDLRKGIDEMMAASGQTFYIVGETFDGESMIKKYIGDTMLHGQFDFPLYNKIRDTLMRAADNDGAQYWQLKDFVNYNDTAYNNMCPALPEKRAIMSTFLGNHDVARAISHIHFDAEDKISTNPPVTDMWAYHRLRVSWAFLMTSPMVPLIYYGDEFGLEGANDPDNRRMMQFGDMLNDQQKETLALVQKLGQIRRDHPVLSLGTRRTINAKERSYMYLMKDANETILVGLSDLGDDDVCEEAEPYEVREGARGWEDLLNPSNVISQTTSIQFCGRKIYVWKAK